MILFDRVCVCVCERVCMCMCVRVCVHAVHITDRSPPRTCVCVCVCMQCISPIDLPLGRLDGVALGQHPVTVGHGRSRPSHGLDQRHGYGQSHMVKRKTISKSLSKITAKFFMVKVRSHGRKSRSKSRSRGTDEVTAQVTVQVTVRGQRLGHGQAL